VKWFRIFLLFGTLCLGSLSGTAQVRAPRVETVKFDWYTDLISRNTDTTLVINFWATWCVPCVAELPYFEQLGATYANRKLAVYLVSLDFVKKKEEVLVPFLEKRKIQSRVVLLNEPNYNAWIDRVDSSWSGALPATLIINNSQKLYHFLEKEVTFAELDSLVYKTLSP